MGKSETTRQEIMKVTKELILRKGYAQVTMNDVTQASGMSAGGLYYHYHTVEEIVTDILQKETDYVWESIGRPDTPDKLIDAVHIYFENEKHELLDHENSLNWVLYEYYFSFPKEEREKMLKEKHEQTADMLRILLDPFIEDKGALDMLIKSICTELLGLTMFSMTGLIDEKFIDNRFDKLLSEIETAIE